jgi:cell wall-associated NlpC family hydrolase
MAVVPADLEAFLEQAVQSDPAPAVIPARPPVLDGLTELRYSIALSSPQDATLRHIPYSALSFEQQSGSVATRVSASIPDVESNLGPLWELCQMGTPLWLLGGQTEMVEMFRGTILEVGDRSSNGGTFGIVAYDGLFNALRSKYDLTFGTDTTVSQVMQRYAQVANVPLGYVEEPGVKLPPLVIRQKTMIDGLTDVLKQVMSKGGGSLKLRVMQGKLELVRPASNPTIYHFRTGGVAIQTTIKGSIADMIDRVVVLGHAADDAELPVIKTMSSDAGFTGAQEMVYAEEADSDQATQLEAESILAEKGFPVWTYGHTGFAVPGIYKWERVHITDGIVDNHFIVSGVSMDLVARTMKMDLMTTEQIARETRQIELSAALDELKGTEKDSTKTATSSSGAAKILDAAKNVMGLAYVSGGAGGRSDFSKDMHHVGTDCSGFVSWITKQLGGTTGTTTDAIAAATPNLIGTNTLDGAAPGDYILYWDGGATDKQGLAYPHVAMYLGNGEVIESGGSTNPSSIGKGHILTGYPRYEVRRNPQVYNALNAQPVKAAGSSQVKVS